MKYIKQIISEDLDTVTETGYYYISNTTKPANSPVLYGFFFVWQPVLFGIMQMVVDSDGQLYIRAYWGSNWSTWKKYSYT